MQVEGFSEITPLASGAHLLLRARRDRDGRSVVLKVPAASSEPAVAAARLRHELQIARDLDPRAVVVPLELAPFQDSAALVLDDPGGTTLSSRTGVPLPLDEFLPLATSLTWALRVLHAAGVLHKDLKPANAVVLPDGSARWTDFGVAARIDIEGRAPGLAGTLAYMAPEQTGRMHRQVDARSDLYALGVTFFELLAGRRPFESSDPMQLIHAHIATPPPDLAIARPDLPPALVAIVHKLLEKAAERRYQTAAGLLADLRRLSGRDGEQAFTLGRDDHAPHFALPQTLVGRDAELRALSEGWAGASGGAAVLVELPGPSGIGKSALARELAPRVARDRGFVLEAACASGSSDLPWAPLLLALDGLFAGLLAREEKELAAWRERLGGALGSSAQVFAELVPSLGLVLGPSPPLPELAPSEAEARFTAALLRLMHAVAGPEHPVMLVVDDAHGADDALLRFLGDLLSASRTGHLMLVLAWRPGEERATLTRARARLAQSAPPLVIKLAALTVEQLGRWLALGLRREEDDVAMLAGLLHGKTAGNPFFVEQFVRRLRADGAIVRDGAVWRIERAAIARRDLTENVASLLREELALQPPETVEALAVAACLGGRFAIERLARVLGAERAEVAERLEGAVQAGILIQLDAPWQYRDPAGGSAAYRFAHQRVRQAAIATVPSEDLPAHHLAIARALAASEVAERDGGLEVARHYSEALPVIEAHERDGVASLLARAARAALDSVAVATAGQLAESGLTLLGADGWERCPDVAASLTQSRAEALFLVGDLDGMASATGVILERAGTAAARVDALELRLHAFSHAARHQEALDACCEALQLLGHPVPRDPSALRGGVNLMLAALRMRRFDPEDLGELPVAADPSILRVMRLMMMSGGATQAVAPGLFAYMIGASLRLTLENGRPPHAPLTYFTYGFVLSVVLGQRERGYRFGLEALRLMDPLEQTPGSARILTLFNTYIRHWREPRADFMESYLDAANAGQQTGDIEFTGYALGAYAISGPTCRVALPAAQETALAHHRDIARTGQVRMHLVLGVLRRELARLTGREDPAPDPEQLLAGVDAETLEACEADDWVRFTRAAVPIPYLLLWGEHDAVLEAAGQAAELDKAMHGSQIVRGMMWRSMACVASAAVARRDPSRAAALRRSCRPMLKLLGKAAAEAPFNYELLERLAASGWEAEAGRTAEALQASQRAVDLAREQRLPLFESIAAQQAAELHAAAGLSSSARGWLLAARTALARWGADALVRTLDARDPTLRTAQVSAPPGGSTSPEGTSSSSDSLAAHGALDMASILKAGQAISREIVLEKLLQRLLSVALENAGATRAVIVLVGEQGPIVAARSDGEADGEPLDSSDALPAGLVRYALRTGKDLVLGDASSEGLFARDPWVVERAPGSVLVVPLMHQNRSTAALYLENPLTTGAFTEARVQVVRSMASQAAIAVENARLYEAQVALTKAQSRFVPHQFLRSLERHDIVHVALGDHVEREMAVLFSDLRGFTRLSEAMGPAETLKLLNRYLAAMEPSIRRGGGFVDKYIGDAILALFEAGPDAALQAAAGMAGALRELNADLAQPLGMGIGVNAGPLTLGTVGARDRVSCTVIGDSVNLASRLEGLTKTYDSAVLVSEYARDRLRMPDRVHLRLVGRVAVTGRVEPLDVWELVDAEPSAVRALREETRAGYEAGVAAFFERDFSSCEAELRQVLAHEPGDSAARRFFNRARALVADPPGPEWTGVEQQLGK